MSRLADHYRRLEANPLGRSLLALIAGLAAALAHPPFGLLPGLLGFALLLRLGDQADPVRPRTSAFFRGWLAGLRLRPQPWWAPMD